MSVGRWVMPTSSASSCRRGFRCGGGHGSRARVRFAGARSRRPRSRGTCRRRSSSRRRRSRGTEVESVEPSGDARAARRGGGRAVVGRSRAAEAGAQARVEGTACAASSRRSVEAEESALNCRCPRSAIRCGSCVARGARRVGGGLGAMPPGAERFGRKRAVRLGWGQRPEVAIATPHPARSSGVRGACPPRPDRSICMAGSARRHARVTYHPEAQRS